MHIRYNYFPSYVIDEGFRWVPLEELFPTGPIPDGLVVCYTSKRMVRNEESIGFNLGVTRGEERTKEYEVWCDWSGGDHPINAHVSDLVKDGKISSNKGRGWMARDSLWVRVRDHEKVEGIEDAFV